MRDGINPPIESLRFLEVMITLFSWHRLVSIDNVWAKVQHSCQIKCPGNGYSVVAKQKAASRHGGTHGDPILHVLADGHNEQPQMGRNFFNIYVIKSNVGKSESISLTYHSSLAVEDNDRIPQQIWVYKIA